MIDIIDEMLSTGVHYGHQMRFCNPKMKRFIYGSYNNVHVINLDYTVEMLYFAILGLKKILLNGGKILFVCTKKNSNKLIENYAIKFNQYFVSNRWLGGMLTNWNTIKKSIDSFKDLELKMNSSFCSKLTKKENLLYVNNLNKLKVNFNGIKNMNKLPDALFIIDVCKEKIAVKEANILSIPIFAIVDTNSNPSGIDYIIPGNDDSYRANELYLSKIYYDVFN